LQVSETLEVNAVAPEPVVAVSVTTPDVAAVHTAVPFVESFALLIVMASGSGFVHTGCATTITAGTAQPVVDDPVTTSEVPEKNCCWFPGAAAMWSAVAVAGEMDSTCVYTQGFVVAPHPVSKSAHPPNVRKALMAKQYHGTTAQM
jgi:hypothetical protein